MIVFQLLCTQEHSFEGWFKDSATYDAQAAAGEVCCPVCGDSSVRKAPMAPRLNKTRGDNGSAQEVMAQVREVLAGIRQQVEQTCDYVGEKFPEEARKIHYGEVDPRPIYGEASKDEAEALREEGVEVTSIPWLPNTDS